MRFLHPLPAGFVENTEALPFAGSTLPERYYHEMSPLALAGEKSHGETTLEGQPASHP